MDRLSLKRGLAGLKDKSNLTPLDMATELFTIRGMTPEMGAQIYPLLQQQNIDEAAKRAAESEAVRGGQVESTSQPTRTQTEMGSARAFKDTELKRMVDPSLEALEGQELIPPTDQEIRQRAVQITEQQKGRFTGKPKEAEAEARKQLGS